MKLLVTVRLPSECYKNHGGQTIYIARDPATGIDKKQTNKKHQARTTTKSRLHS